MPHRVQEVDRLVFMDGEESSLTSRASLNDACQFVMVASQSDLSFTLAASLTPDLRSEESIVCLGIIRGKKGRAVVGGLKGL